MDSVFGEFVNPETTQLECLDNLFPVYGYGCHSDQSNWHGENDAWNCAYQDECCIKSVRRWKQETFNKHEN